MNKQMASVRLLKWPKKTPRYNIYFIFDGSGNKY